jgi:hypothetical protein
MRVRQSDMAVLLDGLLRMRGRGGGYATWRGRRHVAQLYPSCKSDDEHEQIDFA